MIPIILACEISFWAFLFLGLATRYLLRAPRLGAALLVCVPLVDLVLLLVTILHLRSGAIADWTDGLAALYVGFSVTYGHRLIQWTDVRFAFRFAGGPPPPRPPRYGRAHLWYEWREFLRLCLACAISGGLLIGGSVLVGDPARAAALSAWLGQLVKVIVIACLWPLSYTLWPRKRPLEDPANPPSTKR